MTAAPTKLEEELRAHAAWNRREHYGQAADLCDEAADTIASLRTRAETAEALAEALKPFAHLEKAIGIAAGIPDKVQGVVAFKVPRREEWCEFGPIPLGAFRALARAARTLTKEPPDAK